MEDARKKFICLKSLTLIAMRIRKNLKRRPESLAGIAQMTDLSPHEILQLLDQLIGRKEPSLSNEKCTEIAWLICRVALRETFLNDGFQGVLDSLADNADELGIDQAELRQFYMEMIVEITTEQFAP